MKTNIFENREDWLDARKGKITGSKLKDIVVKRGTGEKIGFYQLIADMIATDEPEENPMDRGTRLEDEAMQKFSNLIGKSIIQSLTMWSRSDDERIAVSPDGELSETEAVEVKCLSSARHIEAYITNTYPKEYHEQALQYFIVNESLERLYFVMYDPRMPENIKLIYFVIEREDVRVEIDELLKYQFEKLKMVDEIVSTITF